MIDLGLKVAFVVGHTAKDKGAYSEYLKISEFDLFKKFADVLLKDIGTVFFHDENISSYTKRQQDTAQKTKDFDLVFELHFNAAGSTATGAEAIYYHTNQKAKETCNFFLENWCKITGLKNRGSIGRSLEDRGGAFLYYQKPTAILLEPFFGSNKEDCQSFYSIQLFEAIVKTINYHARNK